MNSIYMCRKKSHKNKFSILFRQSELGSPPSSVCPLTPSAAPTIFSNTTKSPSIPPTTSTFNPVQSTAPIRSPIHPDCPPIYNDSTKGGREGVEISISTDAGGGKGKGKGAQKKMKDKSHGSMSKLTTAKASRRLGVHKPGKQPFVCPELPSIKRPVHAPNSTGKRGDIATKVTTTTGNANNAHEGTSTKAMFSNKKKKIEEGVDRTKPGKEKDAQERKKKSMR
jgi:hypothetical protein